MTNGWCFDCGNIARLFRFRRKTDHDMRYFEHEAAHLERRSRLSKSDQTILTNLRKTPRVKLVGFCPQHYMYQLEQFVEDKGLMEDFEREVL